MHKKSSLILGLILLAIWQLVSMLGLVPSFMLPSPVLVGKAFVADFPMLMNYSLITLQEAFWGLSLGILIGGLLAILMDRYNLLRQSIYPFLTLTQTIPTIAIAPLLVLWLGYGMAPKITLIFIVCFFPITVGFFDGLKAADQDAIILLQSMNANSWQIIRHIKLPSALPRFFSGLKIAVTYSIVGAVIAEWMGGNSGLGVYMTRVRKSYAFDKMFAVIFWISILSILLMAFVQLLQKKLMPYESLMKKGNEDAI